MDSNLYKAVLQVASTILSKEDAEDICQDFWTEVLEDRLTAPENSGPDWYLEQIRGRARKVRNKQMKEGINTRSYTENPTTPTTKGEISDEDLWRICTYEPNEVDYHDSAGIRTIFNSLPAADQEFLKQYQLLPVSELVPKYGATQGAVRQRRYRLRQQIKKELQTIKYVT